MKYFIFILLIIALAVMSWGTFDFAEAHRSGCHRWHSCPSDSGSYTCGDAGYTCQYPTYPKSGGVVYPPSGYYKDCYDCALKKVPENSHTSGINWECDAGYKKVGNTCEKITWQFNGQTYYSQNAYLKAKADHEAEQQRLKEQAELERIEEENDARLKQELESQQQGSGEVAGAQTTASENNDSGSGATAGAVAIVAILSGAGYWYYKRTQGQ